MSAALDEAAAASAAGIDVLSIIDPIWTREMRAAAGDCFVQVGLLYGELCTYEDYLRAAQPGSPDRRRLRLLRREPLDRPGMADEGIPVVGHVGLIPSRATWTGGFRAVGKTADGAMEVFGQVKALEAAGAFAAEIEVVPDRVAAEISRRAALLMFSMGAGTGGDAQYLFAEDVLG